MIALLRRAPVIALLTVLLLAPAAYAGARPLSSEDFYRIEEVRDPQVSPDGLEVAYLVSHNDRASDEYQTTLWTVGWDGGEPVQMTHTARDISAPRYSPDGKYLAFLSTPSGSDQDQKQLLLLNRRGGEPRELGVAKGEISSYAWSPDGRRLVVATDTRADDRKVPPPIVIEGRYFKEDVSGYLTASSLRHLYLIDVSSGAVSPLTVESGHSDDLPQWSPDGSRIAFVRTVERGPDADGMQSIEVIDARPGAAPRSLTRVFAPNTQRLAWTPDGRQIALLQGQPPRFNSYLSDRLALVSADGGRLQPLSDSLDRAVLHYALATDGNAIDALIEDDRTIYPLRLPLDGGAPTPMLAERRVTTDLAAAAGHTALLTSTEHTPPEVYALEHGALRQLTHHNDALLAELDLAAVEDLSFKSRDGTEIHGLLVKPLGYVAGRRYPTVLWIHGGPDGEDERSLLFDGYPLALERQLLAAQGYAVLAINYRGSSGRGRAFQEAIAADWGHKEVEDLLAAVDHVVASGVADASRLGIGGWSYGGLLTDYTIASDRRFKAAVSGAGSGNQLALYGADEYILSENNELGPPWKTLATWLKVSYPFIHADRITTPTLFMGGDRDFNVPIAGSEQMYMALRTLGIPTQLIVYPDQYHILTRPSYLKDRADRILAWYARFLH